VNNYIPTVFVVDDDSAMREALTSLVRSVGLNVQAFASAHEFLDAPRQDDVASCLVLDVRMPGVSGLDLQRELRLAGEMIPIVFITGHADVPTTVRAMKAGAIEFLPKPFREQDLLDGIRQALERSTVDRDERNELERIRTRTARLTRRERQVMTFLLTGLLNKQVAAQLGISEITVKIHRRRIMEKTMASSLVELATMMEKLRSSDAADVGNSV
jgi:FixJ family two-component response regulator